MEAQKKSMTRRAVLLTVCGAVLMVAAFGMLILRYRAVETELDRMLTESLTAHTVEAGEGAGYLIRYAETAVKNADLLIREEAGAPEKSVAELAVKTFDLTDDRMELSYLDRRDLNRAAWGQEEPELLERVRSGEAGVSGLLPALDEKGPYLVVLRPVMWEGQAAGVLQAQIYAGTLLQQGQHSTFFHSVHSVIAGADGRVVFGGQSDRAGLSLVELDVGSGITQREKEAFSAAYGAQESGSFNYDPADGRCYVAWAPVGCNGWRVVQVSQSPNVQLERSSAVQTGVMLISLVVCAILAGLTWRQRARMAEEKLRYNTLAQFGDTMIFEYDCEEDSLVFSSNAMETLELNSLKLICITDEGNGFPVFHPDDIRNVRRILRGAAGMEPGQIEHDRTRMKKRGGGYSWYRSQYKAVFGPDGKVVRVIGTLTDISSQIDRERELRQQAQQDPLTGLYNRAGVKVINARLEQISRGVLFMLDLDDFKSVNDTYGHAAGDKLLIAIARVLEETFRADDIVARVGGDEFVALLSGSNNEEMVRQKAQELLERVHNLRIEGIDTVASVSIGAASAPDHGRTYETLSVVADEALYEIKNRGKGGFALR